MHLAEDTFRHIAALINKAKIETARKDYQMALALYQKAEAAFPQPAGDYSGACFLFYSIAEIFLLMQNLEDALRYSMQAMGCLDGFNDAKAWYQSGLIFLRRNETEPAREYLKMAFIAGGKAVFTSTVQKEIDFFAEHIFIKDVNIVEEKY